MQITFAASECAPWARTGGLADVIRALPRALARMGHRVTNFVPYYRQVAKIVPNPPVVLGSITVPFFTYNRFARILDGGSAGGVQQYFVDCPELFDRESLYATPSGNYEDNAERFGLLCRAVLEASKVLGVPDVFHVHDWQTSLLPVFLRTAYYFDPLLRNIPSLLTVHNAGYQATFPPQTMEKLLLPWDLYTMDRLEQNNEVNVLKGGVVYADALTTVSPSYAQEIQTPELGNGLERMFRMRSADLSGILNGADYDEWDSMTDPLIAGHFSAEDLSGKRECRRDLLHAFGLGGLSDDAKVIGIVSRFATQKGFDLITEGIAELVKRDVAVVILGNGEEYYERLITEMAERHRARVRVIARYDNVIAHKVLAGADMLLMPSKYEPCGLGQIYGMRYGTVPVVRATGGLDDTVCDGNNGDSTGFKFREYTSEAMLAAVDRAMAAFEDKEGWTAMMRRAMSQDFSWDGPAAEYVKVYERVVRNRS